MIIMIDCWQYMFESLSNISLKSADRNAVELFNRRSSIVYIRMLAAENKEGVRDENIR